MRDDDAAGGRRISEKERARLYRREAYQKAKALRAKDPRYAAMKERAKELRRQAYADAKARRDTALGKQKADEKAARDAERAEERRVADEALMTLVARGARSSFGAN